MMTEEKPKAKSPLAAFLVDKQTPIGFYESFPSNFQSIREEALGKEKSIDPTFGETLEARGPENFLFRKAINFQDSLLTLVELDKKGDAEFNPLQDKYLTQVSPEFYPELAECVTEGQVFRKIANIGQREHLRNVREESGTFANLAADIANGLTNPFTYLPVAQGLKTVQALPAAKQIVTKVIPSFMMGIGVDEADLYYNHQQRTAQEAISNTIVGGLMAGVLGGVGLGYRSLKFGTYKNLVTEMVGGKDVKFRFGKNQEVEGFSIFDDSVGAASTRHVTLVGESIYGWGEAGQLNAVSLPIWAAGKLFRNPVIRGLTSKAPSVRKFINEAYEHNFDITSIVEDLKAPPEAIQTAIDTRRSASLNFQIMLADSYYEYLGIDPNKGFVSKYVGAKFNKDPSKLRFDQYSKEFYKATVKGGESEIGEIASTSKKFISEFLDPITKELEELKLLPPNLTPKGAIQHVMRVYDREFITANKMKVHRFLQNKFAETNDRIRREMEPISSVDQRISAIREDLKSVTNKNTKKKLESELKELAIKKEAFDAGIQAKINSGEYTADMLIGDSPDKLRLRPVADAEDISAAAHDTIDTILGLNEEQMNASISGLFKSGSSGTDPLKRRSLMIDDVEMIDNGMLTSDIRKTFSAYNLRMSRLITMEKYLRSNGYSGEGPKLEFLTNGIKNEYNMLETGLGNKLAKAGEGKSGEELAKVEKKYGKKAIELEKSKERDLETVSTTYKRLMGETGVEYGGMLRAMNAVKQFYYSTELGAMVLLQLQDAVVPMFRQGISRYFNNGIRPFLTNLAKLDFKKNKALRNSARDIGLGIDTATAFYNMNFKMDGDTFLPMNFIERLTENASNAMGLLNFSSIWGDTFQHIAATASQSSIVRDLTAAAEGKLSKKYLQRLLGLRITPGEPLANEILSQVKKHGEYENGAWLPNWHLWDSGSAIQREAKTLFQGAIRKEVRSVMFSGSNIASYPVGGSPNGWAGQFLMYMGWGFNATANFTIPLLQKADTSRIGTVMCMLAISSVVEPIRKLAGGDELTEEDLDPAMLFKKGLLNSGLLGQYGDLFNRVNAMGDIIPGARLDRYRNTRGLIQFGPERLIADVANIAGMFVNQEWNKKDWKRVIKNVPLANLLYTRALVNQWIDSWDIPETRHKARILEEWK
jgi:hypothetical protein